MIDGLIALSLLTQAAGPECLEDRFEIPRGFRIYRAADRELCGGSYDIAFDGQGRLLVGDGTQVRRLEDRDGDGVYDASEVIATGLGPRGPQGLLVVGDRLYAVGGDGLQLYTGYEKGPLVHRGRLGAPFSTGGDHAAHQIFRGHDDYLYFIVGDGAGARDRVHITEPHSPARAERGCSVFRISPDGEKWECVATGGRNSPNIGMNSAGDLFSLDSDMEWHVDVPWYRPVRLHHWVVGGDQGWQSVGAYPPYYIDNLPGLRDIGRGSPDWGVFYEHRAFPDRYRDAYFVCDYRSKSATSGGYATAGRLFAFFLARAGSRWSATHEVFAMPKEGAKDDKGRPIDFGLVDIEVAPDGSLFLSDHGQGVWRIFYDPGRKGPPPIVPPATDDLLALPQPSSEWSRLRREALLAAKAPSLEKAARDEVLDLPRRLMAIRHLASRFDAVPQALLADLARDRATEVRAAAAWLLGLQRKTEGAALASSLLKDADPFVRRRALESLMRNPPPDPEPIVPLLGDPDRTVRYAAMIALTHHPRDAWFEKVGAGVQPRMRALVAADLRGEPAPAGEVRSIVRALLKDVREREDRLDLLRILGRFRGVLAEVDEVADHLLRGELDADPQIRWEEARLIGEFRLKGFAKVLAALEREKDPVTQFHLAQALARIPSGWTPDEEGRAVEWLVGAQKGWFAEFAGKGLEFPAFWGTVLAQFAENHGERLLAAVDRVDLGGLLGRAALQALASRDGAADRLAKLYDARREAEPRRHLLAAFERVRNAEASAFLVRELRVLKEDRLRAAAILSLASQPPSEEARFFLEEGLRHEDREVARACALSLARRPSEPRLETCRALLTRMERQRDLVVAGERALVAMSGRVREGYRKDADPRRAPEDPERRTILEFWKAWYARQFSQEYRPLDDEKVAEKSNEDLRKFILSADARGGTAARGRPIFAALCARCHGGIEEAAAGAVLFGPDLAGVTRRMGREEIADSIVYPSKVVAERFRATTVALKNGDILSGFVTEQDEKTLTLAEERRTHRLSRADIQVVKPQETSLMPEFLLNKLGAESLRDLLAFLEEVGAKPEGSKK